MTDVRIVEETWDGASATLLRERMDAEIRPRYADLFAERSAPPVVVDPEDIVFTLVAYAAGDPAGTVSLKRTGGHSEIKRVFVDPAFRRIGLAARLLAAAEERARALGVRDLVLQTGSRQPEAQALYEREGWAPIPPFGPYAGDDEVSRCYAKPIVPLTLGVELAVRGDGAELVADVVAQIAAWEAAGADFAVLPDRYLEAAGEVAVDAPTLATFAAAQTSRIALVPEIATTHTEPFHVAKVVQTLDFVSRGRAGWQVAVTRGAQEAALFGRKAPASDDALWAEAEEALEVAARLWDSWEDDAEIRDVETGRFIDRDRVHHIDFEGRFFSVKGPSIVPRSPQGQSPVVIRVSGDGPELAVAARRADVIRVAADRVPAARAALAEAGREAVVVVDVPASAGARDVLSQVAAVRIESGADGAVVVFAEAPSDAEGFAAAFASTFASVFASAGAAASTSFRGRLGLERPASRYARQESNA
jgi:alkanesulfonate monooxygenase SsuD/methylene tetrahydromethanopterin reductase-like flavin-dependent oxidoreductase (luciferase family)/GNAT superfamily N-acetyltransferase